MLYENDSFFENYVLCQLDIMIVFSLVANILFYTGFVNEWAVIFLSMLGFTMYTGYRLTCVTTRYLKKLLHNKEIGDNHER